METSLFSSSLFKQVMCYLEFPQPAYIKADQPLLPPQFPYFTLILILILIFPFLH